jgi:hypothetical protein
MPSPESSICWISEAVETARASEVPNNAAFNSGTVISAAVDIGRIDYLFHPAWDLQAVRLGGIHG